MVDGLVGGTARLVDGMGTAVRGLQTGLIQNYALLMLFGVFAFVIDVGLFNLLPSRIYGVVANYQWLAIPLFVFMGYIIERANILDRLFRSLQLAIQTAVVSHMRLRFQHLCTVGVSPVLGFGAEPLGLERIIRSLLVRSKRFLPPTLRQRSLVLLVLGSG